MNEGIISTDFTFKKQTERYIGKVRDLYYFSNKIAIVTTDRISAFEVVLPKPIPHKGQVLNQLAATFLAQTSDILPNWVEHTPHPNVTYGKRCHPFKVEMVIRGYLAGHAWREYKEGKRTLCGNVMPEGMRENEKFPEPLITPTIKADNGHDEDISPGEIIKKGLVSESDYAELEKYTRALYQRGSKTATRRGLILVDTKYEFGKYKDTIYLIDEIHTPDSSRYFYAAPYEKRLSQNIAQKQLSKEFVRQWLLSQHFQGKENEPIPEMDEPMIQSISNRYIELYENLCDKKFVKDSYRNKLAEIKRSITNILAQEI